MKRVLSVHTLHAVWKHFPRFTEESITAAVYTTTTTQAFADKITDYIMIRH